MVIFALSCLCSSCYCGVTVAGFGLMSGVISVVSQKWTVLTISLYHFFNTFLDPIVSDLNHCLMTKTYLLLACQNCIKKC